MSKHRITNNTLGVIIGLVISVWWVFMGFVTGFPFPIPDDIISYILTWGGLRETITPVLYLILIPIVAIENKRGFWAALVLSIVLLVFSLLVPILGYAIKIFGPIVFSIIQIPIIIYSYKALQEQSKTTIEE